MKEREGNQCIRVWRKFKEALQIQDVRRKGLREG